MMIAVMPSGETSEETKYVYAATTSGGSDVDSNDLLSATDYPDLTSGEFSSGQQETYTYNALGQETGFADRDGNVHAYSYDLLGRKTLDAVTTLGSGVDGYVMAIGTAFNLQGLPYLYTSYSDADATTVVNQVEDVFNGLGQVTGEYQSHSGAVDTSSTPEVVYGYSDLSSGSRKTSLTYPDGRQIDYNYASGVDSDISRLTSISDNATSTVLESYKYLGLGTIIERDHPEDGVNLTYIGTGTGDGGDQIVGLDRFGRVVDQKWVTSTGTVKDEYQYGYDRDSNVLWKVNTVSTSNSELYTYDDLNRLVEFQRGTLSSDHTSISGTPSETETWTLDALGNQLEVVVNGTTTDNTYNAENELTSTTVSYGGSVTSSETLSYDANGNLLTNSSDWNNYLYDAWNRGVGDAYGGGASPISSDGLSGSEQYAYDALGRRIYNAATGQDIYYDGWQRVEDVITSAEPTETSDGPADVNEYVWSPAYQNALVERDAMNIMSYGGGLYTANLGSQRLYATQDADWNTTALIDTSGDVVERYQYDPYGQVTYLDSSFTPLSTQASNYGWVYLFQGGVLDNNNLYWFEHRDENPATGNWDEQDPAGYVDGADEYQFVGSSPVLLTDASGLMTLPQILPGESVAAAQAAANAAMQTAQIQSYQAELIASQQAAWEQTPAGQAALQKQMSEPVTDAVRYAPDFINNILNPDGPLVEFVSNLPSVAGFYFFGGVGGAAPGDLGGVEGGIGVNVDNGGISFGGEGYAYGAGGPSMAFDGVGGWYYPEGGSSWGPMAGWNFGPFGLEGVYDPSAGQAYLGVSAGQGIVGGGGVCISNLHLPAPPPPNPDPGPPPGYGFTAYDFWTGGGFGLQ